MATSRSTSVRARFGQYEVELSSGDLRRSGVPVRIQEHPLQVLRLLLEAEGRVVTREQLQGVLWPEDTFVDFEHGVNTAVKKLRRVLGDTVENPQFIETLPKFGYRFIAPVEWVGDSGNSHKLRGVVPIAQSRSAPDSQSATGKGEEASTTKTSPISSSAHATSIGKATRLVWRTLGAASIPAALALGIWYLRGPLSPPRITDAVRITNDGKAKSLWSPPVTDGIHLYFIEGMPSTSGSGIAQMSATGERPHGLIRPFIRFSAFTRSRQTDLSYWLEMGLVLINPSFGFSHCQLVRPTASETSGHRLHAGLRMERISYMPMRTQS